MRLVPTVSRSLLREIRQRLGAILLLGALGAVGAGLLVGMLAVFYDLDASRARFYREQRLADFSLSLKRAPRSALEQVRRHPGVRHLEGRVRIEARVDLPGSPEPITSTALSLPRIRRPVLNDILLVSGTWFEGTRDDQTILNDAFARAHGLHPGDHVQALIMGRQQRLLVVGTALAPEFVYVLPPAGGMVPDPARTGVLYLPLDTLQDWAGLNGAFNEFLGLAWDLRPVPLRNTLKDLERQLDPYGVALSLTGDEMPSVQFLANELHELQTSATILPALCLGVVGLVLHIVTGRMVTQQRTTIGTLRALGYTRTFIVRHYLGYGLVVGLSSALAGLALGLWIQSAMIRLYQDYFELPALQPTLYPGLLAGALGVAVLFAVAGTVQAALRASRMNPAEAMRPPAPEKGGRILLERIRGLWDLLPFWGKLVLRSVFRNPFRSMVAILTSLAATALLVESLCMVAAMHAMIDHEFRHTSHQDLTVALREPVGRDILSELRGLPGIAKVEPQLVVSADLSRGAREKRTGLTGLAAGNRLFTPLDARGRPLQIPEEGLVLARKLAEVLGVAPGDTLLLRPLIGTRQMREAPVVAVVDTYMGLGAWCRLEYLSHLIGGLGGQRDPAGPGQPAARPDTSGRAVPEARRGGCRAAGESPGEDPAAHGPELRHVPSHPDPLLGPAGLRQRAQHGHGQPGGAPPRGRDPEGPGLQPGAGGPGLRRRDRPAERGRDRAGPVGGGRPGPPGRPGLQPGTIPAADGHTPRGPVSIGRGDGPVRGAGPGRGLAAGGPAAMA